MDHDPPSKVNQFASRHSSFARIPLPVFTDLLVILLIFNDDNMVKKKQIYYITDILSFHDERQQVGEVKLIENI